MKVKILIVLLLTFKITLSIQAQDFNRIIYLPSQPVAKEVTHAVTDMSYWLEKASNKTFRIKEGDNTKESAIQLQWVDDSDLPESIRKKLKKDGQSFYLFVNGNQSARIIGTSTNSFINGIYTFLFELGFRWYMPGDAWTIVPKLNQVNVKVEKLYTPDFQNRSYFGTGSINAIPVIDPQNSFKQDIITWNRRNRLNSDYPPKGHMGQAFYSVNKKLLDSHPDYFCHDKVNKNGRINITNKEAVEIFVSWAIGQVSIDDRFPLIGVDPADGSGGKDDCLPANMPYIQSWSDKYFWLANEVAQKAEIQSPAARVQLYAYASHAAPPNFDLHKNIYPVIIPYAFQNVAQPQQYIEMWKKKLKGRPMGIYDYWNITQWSVDVPQFNIYSIPEKLMFWKQSNVTTINLESTNAKGPMGHAFWLATQMMWNTSMSFDSLYNEFLQQCFGPAAPDIKAMYERWSRNYQESMEWVFSMQDLNSAALKTNDKAILQRISELKAYVHFLKLYYDYQYHPTEAGYDKLIQYIYSIHHLRLLQTSALQARYIKAPKDYKIVSDKGKTAKANVVFQKLTIEAIEKNFKKDLLESPRAYSLLDFSFNIKKVVAASGKKTYNPLYINGQNSYQFYLAQSRQLSFQAGATQPTKLLLKDSKEKIWLEKIIEGKKEGYENLTISLPAGIYSFNFGAYSRFSRFIFPADIPLFSSNNFYDNYQYPLLYVYVPEGITEIIYKDGHGSGTNKRGFWIEPNGNTVMPEKIKYDIYKIPVLAQQSGKVWILNMGHRSFKLLNIPNVFSISDFVYKK